MSLFKLLIGFALFNVALQIWRGSLIEAIVATVILILTVLADELWVVKK